MSAMQSVADQPLCDVSIRIALVDTRLLISDLLLNAIRNVDPALDGRVFPSATSWQAAMQPDGRDVVLLSMDRQPGRTLEDCINDLRLLQHQNPDTPLIVVSSEEDPEAVCNALDLGAAGYVSTNMQVRAIAQVIHLVRTGTRYVPVASYQSLVRRSLLQLEEPVRESLLSPRETSIAKALRKGTPNKIIAYNLNMCESTVKVHIRSIMKKLNAKNRTQVAFMTNSFFPEEIEAK